MVTISIVDELWNTIYEVGIIDGQDIKQLIETAKMKDLDNLSFISMQKNTFFNANQLNIIKKELKVLSAESNIKYNVLNIIQIAVNKALSDDYLYLKFEAGKK